MAAHHKLTKKLIKWLWYVLAASILFSAVVISLIRFALTEVESYRESIEQLASNAIKHPVFIDSLDAKLVGIMPTLVLKGVRVLDTEGKKEILRVNNANIGVSILQSIKHKKFIPRDILISGTRLALIRQSNGHITLRGFDISTVKKQDIKGDKELTSWFFSQSSLALKESTLVWKDYAHKQKPVILNNINLELNNRGNNHELHGSLSPASLGKKLEVALDITGNIQEPSDWQGDFFIQGDEIYLAEWGAQIQHDKVELVDGIVDFQLWGSLDKKGMDKIYGDISAYQLKIKHTEKNKQLNIGLIGGLFEFGRNTHDWYLNVDRFQYTGTGGILPETKFSVISTGSPDSKEKTLDVRVAQLDLKGISEIVANSGLLEKKYETLVKGLALSGKVTALRIVSTQGEKNNRKLMAHAHLKQISTRQHEKIPGVSNITGDIWFDHNRGKLNLNTESGSIDFGKLFRAPIKLGKLKGTVNWWKYQDGWQVTTNELRAENNDIATLNNISLYLPINGPAYMDLYSSFAGRARYKSNYLPVAIMKKPLIDWLDRSIVSGAISNGGLVFRGRFSDFPFRKPRGQFLAQFYTDNLELDYQKGWPIIKDADFDASFDSKSVKIDLHHARIFSSAVTDTKVAINNFRNAVVDIKGKVTGNLVDVVKYVVKSPLKVSKELLDLNYQGRSETEIALHVPLKKGKGKSIGYTGKVAINKGRIQLIGDSVSLANINGDITFSNRGFGSRNLTADVFDKTSVINIYSQDTGKGKKTYLATSGETDVQKLLKSFFIPAYKHSKGDMKWQAMVDFSDNIKKVPLLTVNSELENVAFDIPYPFKKDAASSRALRLQAYFKGKGVTELNVEYDKLISLATRLVKKNASVDIERGQVRFGGGGALLPKSRLLYVSGNLEQFYPGRWVQYMSNYRDFSGRKKFNLPIRLNMNRLSVDIDEQKEKKDVAIKPAEFPVINGTIQDLKFAGMPLGKLSVDMIHHKGDMQLNKLNISSTDMEFNSSGRWEYINKKHSSRLNISLKSDDLGKLFKRLGLAAIINNGKSDIKGSINWPGTPFGFSLGKLNGDLKIYIKDGSIADVDPGAGRVVGLLSLSELPRRLMLDFSDVFKKGLVFDEIKGDVRLINGDAFTDAINVESTVADVKLVGRTGLVEKDYGLLVYVVPKVGETLPVASGVLFGSQIGALVLLFEKMMGKEIEKATERKYKVTGSWDEPVIERIDQPAEPGSPEEDVFGEE